jgi:uncharacterized Zn finger protein
MVYKFSCPTGDKKELPKPIYLSCPKCGEEVELWTDEPRGECEECGALVEAEPPQ